MRTRKYTLPRHTNLASQGLRFVAALVDFAFALAFSLAFYFGCFNLILSNNVRYMRDELDNFEVNSHLKIRQEDELTKIIDSNNPDDYENALEGFYLRYLTGEILENEAKAPNYNEKINIDNKEYLPKEYYSIEFFNKEVLGIVQDNPDGSQSTSYFTYQKDDEGNFLKDKVGVKRTQRYNPDLGKLVDLTDTDFLVYYKQVYVKAYNVLVTQNFYQNVANTYYFYYTLGFVLSVIAGGLICYIIIPLFIKNGQTIGKKIFKLGLANSDGYKFSNYQLILRFIPVLFVSLALLIPIWSSLFFVFAFVITILLASFAFMMASPKKGALHDFIARTIVIDKESSIIFENELEEEKYIEQEDNLPRQEGDGEEPELKYER